MNHHLVRNEDQRVQDTIKAKNIIMNAEMKPPSRVNSADKRGQADQEDETLIRSSS